ncbi:Predicted nucleic acid-binding protein, contains PIN domain [Parafilimonas terrae]|uniref:Predicted nucleic acid-binding protein, contains PIN domain n=2 Tax=Parafilimonas terrae TaxID=1465490 RepID=A0A1I5U7R8_9BACT|nr:Predicted nucleic acid-binding protein, contains PIN domain [Parafilimonas terrae]
MAFRIMLDSNIILDLSLQRSDDLEDLKSIYRKIIEGEFRCYSTTSIIHTCAHFLIKSVKLQIAKEILLSLLVNVKIIEANHDLVKDAIQSGFIDIEDALQYYTALHHKVDCVLSRDKKFIKAAKPQLPVYDPATFIKKFMN